MAFDEAAAHALIANAASYAEALGVFRTVNTHEPKAPPPTGLRYAVWVDEIAPAGPDSGLAETSGIVTLVGRVFGNMLARPEDEIDPRMTSAVTRLMITYSGHYTLGGTIRNIDLMRMGAKAGYVTYHGGNGDTTYRIMDLTIPCVVNDMWDQAP